MGSPNAEDKVEKDKTETGSEAAPGAGEEHVDSLAPSDDKVLGSMDERTVFKDIYELIESRPKANDPRLKTEYNQADEENRKLNTSNVIEEINEERVSNGKKGGCIIVQEVRVTVSRYNHSSRFK